MGKIEVNGIRTYGHHGCLDEEAKIGQLFVTDVLIHCDLGPSAEEDDLSLTVDYCLVTHIVKEEMSQRAKLIETVAKRIALRIKAIDIVDTVTVKVIKPKPPIDGDVREVSVSETL